jgi:HlyD family secretion protein
MSLVAIPTVSSSSTRRIPLWLLLVGALVMAGAALFVWAKVSPGGGGGVVAGNYQPVQYMDLDVRLTKDGELQSMNNIDVINKVEGLNTIQELVNEGTFVHKGDVLVTLDSSSIQKTYDQSLLDLQAAEAALSAAKEAKEIQEATNVANLQEAQLGLEVANLDLKEYLEGIAPQAESEAKTKFEMAKIMVENKEQDLAITRTLFAKGFVTAVDVKKGELDLLTVKNDLKKAETDLKVLLDYTNAKELATKKSAVAQAQQKVELTKKENNANLNRYITALRAAEQTLNLRKQLTDKSKEQLDNCTITAPADGLVVYASSSSRSGDDQIKEGSSVRMRQVICRLPDTTAMKAVIRVQEGQVSKLRVDDNNPMRATVKIIGFNRPVGATVSRISVLADSSQRWWNPDVKEYPVDLVLDETPPNVKPGLSATVEVLVDRRPHVLAVPLVAIYAQGSKNFVFVRGENGEPHPAEIKMGVTNEAYAEVVSGVTAGQQVLLLQPGQGRGLLEKAGIKTAPATRPGDMPNAPKRKRPANNTKSARLSKVGKPKAQSAEATKVEMPKPKSAVSKIE